MLSACQVVDKIISRIFSFRLNTRIILKLARHKLTNFLPPTSKVCLHLNSETGNFLCYIAKLCLAWFSGHWLVVVVLKPFDIRHINGFDSLSHPPSQCLPAKTNRWFQSRFYSLYRVQCHEIFYLQRLSLKFSIAQRKSKVTAISRYRN